MIWTSGGVLYAAFCVAFGWLTSLWSIQVSSSSHCIAMFTAPCIICHQPHPHLIFYSPFSFQDSAMASPLRKCFCFSLSTHPYWLRGPSLWGATAPYFCLSLTPVVQHCSCITVIWWRVSLSYYTVSSQGTGTSFVFSSSAMQGAWRQPVVTVPWIHEWITFCANLASLNLYALVTFCKWNCFDIISHVYSFFFFFFLMK